MTKKCLVALVPSVVFKMVAASDTVDASFDAKKAVAGKESSPDHLLLDRSPNIGPLISCWELDKLKNC